MVLAASRLLLIRHAEVDTGDDGGIMCGWFDLPLSPNGELQLRGFRNEPSVFKPEAVYASSFSRALVTAEALAANWSLPVNIDPQLREISCGALEGMPVEEVKRCYPELWTQNTLQDNCDFAWPSGETYRNFRQRVFEALSRIASRHTNARIPVVTHSGVIAQVIGSMKGLSPAVWEQYRPAPLDCAFYSSSSHAPQGLRPFGSVVEHTLACLVLQVTKNAFCCLWTVYCFAAHHY